MNNCNSCNKSDCCGGKCSSAKYNCNFDIQASPYNPDEWVVTNCGMSHKVRIPKINETCTSLSTDWSNATLNYKGECDTDSITGEQLGSLINLEELRNMNATDADPCDLLVFSPGCTGDACKPDNKWHAYHIPEATDHVVEAEAGYYHVLVKDDCGCIKEDRVPVVAPNSAVIGYFRDSVPDDPDFPWYYGQYNDTVQLYLADNAPEYFGKFDLEVTVNYGIQVIKSHLCKNVNFRSLVVPVVQGETVDVEHQSSILQSFSIYSPESQTDIPWGTTSLRSTITFLVPKGKEASLHHEFRLRTNSSFPRYYENPTYDGKIVPTNIATQVDQLPHNASRLNQLQVIIRPAQGVRKMTPHVDVARNQLDPAVDTYPAN